MLIEGADKNYIKKLAFSLIKEVLLYVIREKLMEEFRKRDLHIEYQKEIEEWFIYLDQQKFGRKLKEKILIEINKFIENRESIEELMERIFGKTEWEIEFIEGIEANYFFKSALGYS